MRDRGRVRTRTWLTVAAAATLLLAACAGDDGDGVAVASAEQEPDASDEDTDTAEEQSEDTEEAAADPDPDEQDTGSSGATEADEGAGDGDAEGGEDAGEAALGACDLAAADGGTTLDADTYEQRTLEANFELELLVSDLAADLDELLSGVSDGPTLEGQLEEHRVTYADAVEPLREVAPPDGAEEWHERAMTSFDDVCTAIEDGMAGSAEGDEERFEAFVAAVTEFPGLINGLHANAACGPFETC